MKKENLYISTMASDAKETAERYGLGIELAQFCTAWNMDLKFKYIDPLVKETVKNVDRIILHAPFNELSPVAIDPLVLEVTEKRIRQAAELCVRYGAKKMVFHSGYTSHMYYKIWYEPQAVKFFKRVMPTLPGDFTVVLENVFEDEPNLLMNVIKEVDSERLKLCVDVGHVNASLGFAHRIKTNRIGEDISSGCRDVYEWIERSAPYISHYHIHNNYGERDTHNVLADGTIDMKSLFSLIDTLTPDATCTLELSDAGESVKLLMTEGFLQGS